MDTAVNEQAAADQATQCVFTGQPIFTLKSSDITADLLVDLWVKIQLNMRKHLDEGLTLEEAVRAQRFYWGVGLPTNLERGISKLDSALAIGEAMRQCPKRKLAD